MKVALVNVPWPFEDSVYFGCREPHLPLELGYAKALLERAGHHVLLVDAQLGVTWTDREHVTVRRLDDASLRATLAEFRPEMTAVTTAPSYLFWRRVPPELRVPMPTAIALRDVAGLLVAVGPHASTTPRATMRKLSAEVAIIGDCEDILARLADAPNDRSAHPSTVWLEDGELCGDATSHAAEIAELPALTWPRALLREHRHHHQREGGRTPEGPGAEIEASRGPHQERPLEAVLDELDTLQARGVRYVYFVDEIFVGDGRLLEALAERDVLFGVRTRIDDWSLPMLDLLGRAGCVSLLDATSGESTHVAAWRAQLAEHGARSNGRQRR